MKQICVDARMAFHSGIGTYIRNVLPYLNQAFTSIKVLAPFSMLSQWPELKEYDFIPLKAPLYSIQEQLQLPFCIPSCDLYWTPHYNIPILPIRARKRVVTIHDVYHLVYGHTLSLPKRLYAKVMIKSATLHADRIITGSKFSLDEIVKYTGASSDKISMIHDGVDSGHFSTALQTSERERVKALYNLPQKYFLFVSTLAPHKNLYRLLKAWNEVINKHCDWFLVLAGKQVKNVDYLKVLDAYPALKTKVQILGQVADKDLQVLYKEAYASITPSLYEGFGLPPLEAMATDCPAIVSETASLPEVCGDAALYVNPLDEKDIAAQICILIEDLELRQHLIQKGRERIKLFRWEKTAQEHIKMMDSLL